MLFLGKTPMQVYNYCISYTLHNGKFPTYDEIAAEFKFGRERARQLCERLVEVGYLKKHGKLHRSYEFRVVVLPNITNTVVKKIREANKKLKKRYGKKSKQNSD